MKGNVDRLIVLLARFRQSLFRIHEEILPQWNTQTSVKPRSWLTKICDLFNHLSLSQVFSLSLLPDQMKITLHFLQHIHHSIMMCVCDLNWINTLPLVWPQIKMNTEATIPCKCLSACLWQWDFSCSDQTRKIGWEENGREEYCIKKTQNEDEDEFTIWKSLNNFYLSINEEHHSLISTVVSSSDDVATSIRSDCASRKVASNIVIQDCCAFLELVELDDQNEESVLNRAESSRFLYSWSFVIRSSTSDRIDVFLPILSRISDGSHREPIRFWS